MSCGNHKVDSPTPVKHAENEGEEGRNHPRECGFNSACNLGNIDISRVRKLGRSVPPVTKVPRALAFTASDLEKLNITALKFSRKDVTIECGLNFKAWTCTIPEQYGICLGIISGVVEIKTSDAMNIILEFIHEIASGYFSNPYHNFLHALDVMYMSYWMLVVLDVQKKLQSTPLQHLALVVSALVHDVLHPGLSSSFINITNPEVCKRFGPTSTLEKQSIEYFRKTLNKYPILDHIDLDENLRNTTIYSFVDQVSTNLLYTDIVQHFFLNDYLKSVIEKYNLTTLGTIIKSILPRDAKNLPFCKCSYNPNSLIVGQMCGNLSMLSIQKILLPVSKKGKEVWEFLRKEYKKSQPGTPPPYVIYKESEKELIFAAILHAADISNAVRPLEICKYWSEKVCEESYNQGDREKILNIPVSPNMDRETSKSARTSLDFCTLFVRPYYEILLVFFPKIFILIDNLLENEIYWRLGCYRQGISPDIEERLSSDGNYRTATSRRISTTAGIIELPESCGRNYRENNSKPKSNEFCSLQRSRSEILDPKRYQSSIHEILNHIPYNDFNFE